MAVEAQPVLKLSLPDTTCMGIAWGSHELIAASCNNGQCGATVLAEDPAS